MINIRFYTYCEVCGEFTSTFVEFNSCDVCLPCFQAVMAVVKQIVPQVEVSK